MIHMTFEDWWSKYPPKPQSSYALCFEAWDYQQQRINELEQIIDDLKGTYVSDPGDNVWPPNESS